MNSVHTSAQIEDAIRELGLWGKLINNPYATFHVGDRVTCEMFGNGTILGQQMSMAHYAVLFDDGHAERAMHHLSLYPLF